jgi:hypothetical protein
MTAAKEAILLTGLHRVALGGMPAYEQAISEKLTEPLYRVA